MTAQGCATVASLIHGVSVKDIMGYSRLRHIVYARWDAWHIARRHGWSLEKIGREFNRDHTTVMHGLKRREQLNADLAE